MTDTPLVERLRGLIERLEKALAALCDQDAAYSGNQILITCHSHSDAIERMRIARETLAILRALQEQSK